MNDERLRGEKSILPLSAKDDDPRKQAVRTTIVGAQPPGNERPLQKIPVGIEEILAMAAVDPAFAEKLSHDRANAIRASGVALTPSENAILASIDNATVERMVRNISARIPDHDRRAFLQKSAAALLALVGGGIVVSAAGCERQEATKGIRPDAPAGVRPDLPASKGERPDMPPSDRKVPTWPEAKGEVPKDEEAAKKATVFEHFPVTAENRSAKTPFFIYFHKLGKNETCAKFESNFADAPAFDAAVKGCFRKYVCDAANLDKTVVEKYGITTPALIIFDALGNKVHSLTEFPQDDKELSEKMKEIKHKSDESAGVKQPLPPTRGHGADLPPKSEK